MLRTIALATILCWPAQALAVCEGGDDSDDDTIPDTFEDLDGDGDCSNDDSDGDGIPDYLDEDDDDDGIPTIQEGDGDDDRGPGVEGGCLGSTFDYCLQCSRPQPDGVPNYLDLDSDGDTIPDADEGLSDLDRDGIPGFRDCDDCSGPERFDCDSDGLLEDQEGRLGLSDGDPDMDDDGILDGCEVDLERLDHRDTDNDRTVDALDPDDDGDGVLSRFEGGNVEAPVTCDALPDLDLDGLADPYDSDDDGDACPTAHEAADPNGDGDPSDARDSNGDGVPDWRNGVCGDDSDTGDTDDTDDTDVGDTDVEDTDVEDTQAPAPRTDDGTGACRGCSGQASSGGATWLLLTVLLALRRRRYG